MTNKVSSFSSLKARRKIEVNYVFPVPPFFREQLGMDRFEALKHVISRAIFYYQ